MEIDAFNQCLTYLALTNKDPSAFWGGVWTPALSGVVVGFMANQLAETFKKRKDIYNKKKCIREEVLRLQDQAHLAFRSALPIIDSAMVGEIPTVYVLPRPLKCYCISEYFASIAHTYGEKERDAVFNLISTIETLNRQIEAYAPGNDIDSPEHLYGESRNLLFIANHCSMYCDCFINKVSAPPKTYFLDLADRLEVNSEYLTLRRKQRNEDNAVPKEP